ncbi:gephyrin-like molybdotransferase Glp [Alteromonas ponticola]|uniref:Molybdopterin molybdenumtransferase n=1 Tax=Alteromonas ponticola TaxID=2720613 RepID=A0ABX1R3U0_9ALTE|nr:gephyrin-like molybdotransferase Glp [Alteromonas ponticola]NMH61112.1 molybdopterin molybdotransferase MoeA [Alteromonas ponticola]
MQQTVSSSLLPLAEALAKIHQIVAPITATEIVPLNHAINRVIAQDVFSTIDVPGSDSSAMDGYALCFHRTADHLQFEVIGEITAGMAASFSLNQGQAARIMTGAPLPPNTDAVVMQENVIADDKVVELKSLPIRNANIRRSGADICRGETLLRPGERLTAARLMLCASAGIDTVEVYKKIRVGIVSTGNEVIEPGTPLSQGMLYDCNRIGIASLLQPLNVEVTDYGIVPDRLAALQTVFTQAESEVDVLISSGGVSVGAADLVKEALSQSGQIDFWKVAIKPGKPFALGRIGTLLFCGLPGNPVSAFVTAQKLVIPAIKQLQHELMPHPIEGYFIHAKLMRDIDRQPGRQEFLRANLSQNEQGELVVAPQAKQSSAALQALALANCYIVVPAEVSRIAAGNFVDVEPF